MIGPRRRLPVGVPAEGVALGRLRGLAGGPGRIAAVAITLALACADDGSSSAAPTSADSSDDLTGCARAPDAVVHQSACPLSKVCPTTFRYGGLLGCGGPLELGLPYSSDERCVLAALADGLPARIVLEESCGAASEDLTLDLLGGRDVVLRRRSVEPCDACGCEAGEITWGSVDRCTLVDLARFSACLEVSDVAGRIACMTPETWLVGCDGGGPLCSADAP